MTRERHGGSGWVAGVDGGATRLRIVLARAEGEVVARGEVPGVAFRQGRERALSEALLGALAEARAAVVQPVPLRAVRLGLAGCGGPLERRAARELAARVFGVPEERVHVSGDLALAHEAAFATGAGIVAVAGTGSGALGRSRDGRQARAGGLGPALDDAGSAFGLGRAALRAAARASEGRAPATVLAERLPAALSMGNWREVSLALEDGRLARAGVAALAPLVVAAAEEGDPTSDALVAEAAWEIAGLAAAVARRLEDPTLPVAVLGGLGRAAALRERIERALAARLPRAPLSWPDGEPAVAAARSALNL